MHTIHHITRIPLTFGEYAYTFKNHAIKFNSVAYIF